MSAASLADAGGERAALAGVLWCLEFASITITRSNGGYDITVWPLGEGTGFVRVTNHNSATVHCYSWSEVYVMLSEPIPPLWAWEIRGDLMARSSGGKWT